MLKEVPRIYNSTKGDSLLIHTRDVTRNQLCSSTNWILRSLSIEMYSIIISAILRRNSQCPMSAYRAGKSWAERQLLQTTGSQRRPRHHNTPTWICVGWTSKYEKAIISGERPPSKATEPPHRSIVRDSRTMRPYPMPCSRKPPFSPSAPLSGSINKET